MLYYSALHPEWDCFGEGPQAGLISELLAAVATNHGRLTGDCFTQLERLGVFLGGGGFGTILLQRAPDGPLRPEDGEWPRAIVAAAKVCLSVPLWYCFSIGGRIYILCCFPRLREGDPAAETQAEALFRSCDALRGELKHPALRVIVSDLQYGEDGIFRTFNNLHHAMEYYDFRESPQLLIRLNSEQQLHGGLIGDMSVYRQLSVAVAERLSRGTPEALADEICDTILTNCVPSMESVHHHIQIFMLTFTDYLGGAGLVDASYMSRHQIVYRAMGFERERELRAILASLLGELQRQNQTLRKIGRQKRIQSVREYVEAHIDDPALSVAQISDVFQISAAQIAKQFRYYYGVSLYRFLQQTRFHRAESLLADHPDWPMRRVAEAAGYADLSTMYRAFRALGNVTPGALRDSLYQDSLAGRD